MAFLHSVIGDNTIDNREHLEKIGYTMSMVTMDKALYLKTQTNGKYYETNKDDWSEAIVNCIGNPQLFKAVSAMRDDSDYMQYFVENVNLEIYDADWALCQTNYFCHSEYTDTSFHKATLSELQEHFQRV